MLQEKIKSSVYYPSLIATWQKASEITSGVDNCSASHNDIHTNGRGS